MVGMGKVSNVSCDKKKKQGKNIVPRYYGEKKFGMQNQALDFSY